MLTNDVVFDVDLNAVRDGYRITTLTKHAVGFLHGGLPRIEGGDWVHIRDEDGNLWAALVDEVNGGRIRLKIDWSIRSPKTYDLGLTRTFGVPTTQLGPVVVGASAA